MHNQIAPHGGELVNRTLKGGKRDFWNKKSKELSSVIVDKSVISDIEMIACGAMSPIEGFMCRDDYNHVIEHMRLTSGLPWSLPIVLGVSRDKADEFDAGDQIALKDKQENEPVLQLIIRPPFSRLKVPFRGQAWNQCRQHRHPCGSIAKSFFFLLISRQFYSVSSSGSSDFNFLKSCSMSLPLFSDGSYIKTISGVYLRDIRKLISLLIKPFALSRPAWALVIWS